MTTREQDATLEGVRMLLSQGSVEPDRQVQCIVCGGPAVCPGWIWATARHWSKHVLIPRGEPALGSGELVGCDACRVR